MEAQFTQNVQEAVICVYHDESYSMTEIHKNRNVVPNYYNLVLLQLNHGIIFPFGVIDKQQLGTVLIQQLGDLFIGVFVSE